jgi:signal transduction histidine kinase
MTPSTQAPATTPRPFPWVFSLLYLGVLFAAGYYEVTGFCGGGVNIRRWVSLASVLLLPLALEQFERWRYGPRTPRLAAIVLLVARMLLFEVVVAFDCSGFSKFLYLIVPFLAYFSLGKIGSYGLAALYVGVFMARLWSFTPTWYLNQEWVSDLLIFAIGLVFAISVAGVVSDEETSRARAEKLLADLELSHQALKAYADQVAGLAAAEERNRLARDIHDSLGHYLTAINVQLEKAITFRQRDPAEAEKAVGHAKRAAKEALQDVRQSVGALRSAQAMFSLRGALGDLVTRMGNAPFAIDLQIEGDEAAYSKLALMSLYRAAQEGLTNIHKHAQARRAAVRVTLGEREARLTIGDDGRGFEPAFLNALPLERDERFGLQGLQERLELVGGSLKVESCPGQGTQLCVTIPPASVAHNAEP